MKFQWHSALYNILFVNPRVEIVILHVHVSQAFFTNPSEAQWSNNQGTGL